MRRVQEIYEEFSCHEEPAAPIMVEGVPESRSGGISPNSIRYPRMLS